MDQKSSSIEGENFQKSTKKSRLYIFRKESFRGGIISRKVNR